MRRNVLALVPLAAVVAGCSSTPTRFWTIEPVAAVAPAFVAGRLAPIQVAAVHLPLAIDRLEVVQHDVASRVTVLDFDRWSAPPGDLIRRALTQDLVARLPQGSVIFPDAPAPTGARSIVVDVLDFSQTAGAYVMQVSWTFTGTTAVPHTLRLQAPRGGGDVAAQTVALSRMTADLSDAIARDVQR